MSDIAELRILQLHNKYQQPGGEDVVVEAEFSLLDRAGVRVTQAQVHNDEIASFRSKARAFVKAGYDSARETYIEDLLRETRANVVHIHNFFPLLTPAVHVAASRAGAGVVQTLHNFRLTCAGGLLMRENKVCEKCLGGSAIWGVVHRCYRGSFTGSAAVASMIAHARRNRIWHDSVDRFILLTQFARQKFIESGLSGEKIAIKPNFVDDRHGAPPVGAREPSTFLSVGRVSAEKGLLHLIEAARAEPKFNVRIIGDGPQRSELEAIAPSNVQFLGRRDPTVVRQEMERATALVVPSLWYEGFPMTLVEAYAAGLPVIASDLGSLSELVVPGETGEHVPPGDVEALAATMTRLGRDGALVERLSAGARHRYLESYGPQSNLETLLGIYREAHELAQRKPHSAT